MLTDLTIWLVPEIRSTANIFASLTFAALPKLFGRFHIRYKNFEACQPIMKHDGGFSAPKITLNDTDGCF